MHVEPSFIASAEDIKSTKRWRDKLIPYHHQVTNLLTFCRRLQVTILTDGVGSETRRLTVGNGNLEAQLGTQLVIRTRTVYVDRSTCPSATHGHQDRLRGLYSSKRWQSVLALGSSAPQLKPKPASGAVRRTADETGAWDSARAQIERALKGWQVPFGSWGLSPARSHLATCSEVKTLLGLRVSHIGAIFDLGEHVWSSGGLPWASAPEMHGSASNVSRFDL